MDVSVIPERVVGVVRLAAKRRRGDDEEEPALVPSSARAQLVPAQPSLGARQSSVASNVSLAASQESSNST